MTENQAYTTTGANMAKDRSHDLVATYEQRLDNFQGEPCVACGAEEKPAPEVGKGATMVLHTSDCDFMAWCDESAAQLQAVLNEVNDLLTAAEDDDD